MAGTDRPVHEFSHPLHTAVVLDHVWVGDLVNFSLKLLGPVRAAFAIAGAPLLILNFQSSGPIHQEAIEMHVVQWYSITATSKSLVVIASAGRLSFP